MYCRNCGKVIPDSAKFCEHCGQATQDSTTDVRDNAVTAKNNKKKNRVGLILAIFAGLCIVGMIITNGLDTAGDNPSGISQSSTTGDHEDTTTRHEDTTASTTVPVDPYANAIAITADELFSAYDTNEVAADNQYKGKDLKISGTIKDIGKDILDNVYITLDCGEMIFSIQCYFDDSEVAVVGTLKKDQDITVIGTCDGQTGNVVIKHCTIAD